MDDPTQTILWFHDSADRGKSELQGLEKARPVEISDDLQCTLLELNDHKPCLYFVTLGFGVAICHLVDGRTDRHQNSTLCF